MFRGINEFKSDTLIREKPFEAKEPIVTVGMSFKNTAVCVLCIIYRKALENE